MIYEDQGNKFKLYLQSKKNVVVLDQLYSYRLHEDSIMDTQRKGRSNLTESLKNLQICIFNWNKLMYYVDIANYKVEEMRAAYIKKLDKLSAEVNLGEEDNKIYREAINKQKQKLQRYWNM